MIHFEQFLYILEVMGWSSFSYIWMSSCSSIICWKDCPYSIALPLYLCQKSVVHVYVGLLLYSLFSSSDLSWHQYQNFLLTVASKSFFKNKFIYLFLAVLGLRCCAQAFSSCGERGLLFLVLWGLLIAVASLVVEHRLSSCGSWALERRFSSCGLWALEHRFSSCGSRALEHRVSSCGARA